MVDGGRAIDIAVVIQEAGYFARSVSRLLIVFQPTKADRVDFSPEAVAKAETAPTPGLETQWSLGWERSFPQSKLPRQRVARLPGRLPSFRSLLHESLGLLFASDLSHP